MTYASSILSSYGSTVRPPTGNLSAVAHFAAPALPWETMREAETRAAVERVLGADLFTLLDPRAAPNLNAPSIAALSGCPRGYPTMRGLPVQWHPQTYNATPSVLDPIQGCLNDCYLIASFSAEAWCRPIVLASALSQCNDFAVPVYNNIPIFARLGWPAILERKFADADYDNLDDGGWLTPLDGSAQTTAMLTNPTPGELDAMLAALGDERATMPAFLSSPWVKEARERGLDDPRRYGVVPGHAFTYLGRGTIAGETAVVSRNPWGWGVPPSLGVGTEWQGLELGEHGVFALPVGVAARCFGMLQAKA